MKNKLIWWKFFFLDYSMVFWLLLVRNKKSTLDSIQFNWIHLNLKLHNLKKFITTKHDKGVCFKRKLCNGTMHLSKPKSNMLMGKTLMKKKLWKILGTWTYESKVCMNNTSKRESTNYKLAHAWVFVQDICQSTSHRELKLNKNFSNFNSENWKFRFETSFALAPVSEPC